MRSTFAIIANILFGLVEIILALWFLIELA